MSREPDYAYIGVQAMLDERGKPWLGCRVVGRLASNRATYLLRHDRTWFREDDQGVFLCPEDTLWTLPQLADTLGALGIQGLAFTNHSQPPPFRPLVTTHAAPFGVVREHFNTQAHPRFPCGASTAAMLAYESWKPREHQVTCAGCLEALAGLTWRTE